MDIIKEFFEKNYLQPGGERLGILVSEIVLVIGIIIFLLLCVRQKANIGKFILMFFIIALLYAASLVFNMIMLNKVITHFISWIFGVYIIIYAPEIRAFFENKKGKEHRETPIKSKKEKEVVINTICNTIDYLSKRKIGALITFERKESLDTLIQNAISINSDITKEILTTIFTPGTACHDGGVIIRGNKIICAGAYYPLTDNADVPKFLGTRHRAAIGISEKYDAISIVVSEETGNISITISGNINLELSIERVKSFLDGYLLTM